jgi:hypothetical protein
LEIHETLPKLYKKKGPKERERKRSKGKRISQNQCEGIPGLMG